MPAAFVQAANGTGDASSNTVAATMASNTTAGNALLAAVFMDDATSASITGVADGGDTFNFVEAKFVDANNTACQIWYALNIASRTTPTITASFSPNCQFRRIVVFEVSGLLTSGALDKFTHGEDSTRTPTTASVTTTTDGQFIFAAIMNDGGDAGEVFSAGSGYIEPANSTAGAAGNEEMAEYQIQGSAGGITASWTRSNISGTPHNLWILATFKAVASAIPPFSSEELDQAQALIVRSWHESAASLPYLFIGRTGRLQPYGPSNLPPQITAVQVDNPSFANERLNQMLGVCVWAWQPDPWQYSFQGGRQGRQPYGPRQLPPQILGGPPENPPFGMLGRDINLISETAAIAQPDPWSYTFVGRQGRLQPYGPANLPPSLIVVPEPPHAHAQQWPWNVQQAAAAAAQPPGWPYTFLTNRGRSQPYAPGNMSPGIPGQSVDFPPFVNEWMDQQQGDAVLMWQPLNPPPTPQRKLSPGLLGPSVDNPPFAGADEFEQITALITVAWRAPDQLPTLPGKLNPSILNNPPNPPSGRNIMRMVEVARPLPILSGKLSPGIPGQSVDPPPAHQERQSDQLQASVALSQPPTWVYSFIGGKQPYEPRRLAQPFVAAAAKTPYSPDWMANLLTSWQPPDPPPTLPRNLSPGIPGMSVDPPPGILAMSVVNYGDDPLPTLGRKVVQPFVSGQNPYTQRWFPLSWWAASDPLPTLPKLLNAGLLAVPVNNPPFTHRERVALQANIVDANQPPPPWPFIGGPGPMMPYRSVFGVRVDNPPFTHWGRVVVTAQIVGMTQPPDPQPFMGGSQPLESGKLTPSMLDVPVNNPSGRNIMRMVEVARPLPILPQKLNPALLGRVDNPPFTHWGRVVVTASITMMTQPPDPQPFIGGRQPLEPKKLNPSILDVPVNNPPFTSRTHLPNILRSWEDPPPLPWFHNLYVQPLAVTYVPYSQDWLPSVLTSWVDPIRLPDLPRKLSPGIPGQSVDNPPRLRARADWPFWDAQPQVQVQRAYARFETTGQPFLMVLTSTVMAWQPLDFRIEPQRKISPSLLQPVDNPPFLHRGRQPYLATMVLSWQPPDPLPTPQRKLPPTVTAVPVNNPPFDMRGHLLPSIIQMWQPEPFVFRPPYVPTARHIQPFLGVRIVAKPSLIGQDFQASIKGVDASPSISGQKVATTLKGKVEND